MVDLSRDDMLLFITIEACQALQTEVIGLSGTRGEHNLFALRTNQTRNLLASILTGLFSIPTVRMRARVWVAVALSQKWKHFIEDSEGKHG